MSELQKEKLNPDFLHQVSDAIGDTSDEINDGRSGCFEFCDGSPEALSAEIKYILQAVTDEATPANDVLESAKVFGQYNSRVTEIAHSNCPGGYALFEADENCRDEETGEPIVKSCHQAIKAALDEVAVDFTNRS